MSSFMYFFSMCIRLMHMNILLSQTSCSFGEFRHLLSDIYNSFMFAIKQNCLNIRLYLLIYAVQLNTKKI